MVLDNNKQQINDTVAQLMHDLARVLCDNGFHNPVLRVNTLTSSMHEINETVEKLNTLVHGVHN